MAGTAPWKARAGAGDRHRPAGGLGHTFVELLIAMVILVVMAGAVLPVAAITRKREKEIELRRELREMRAALDMYHQLCFAQGAGAPPVNGPPATVGGNAGQTQQISQIEIRIEDDPDRTCYPKDLDVLTKGVETNIPDYKLKFLRRIPQDPLNVDADELDQHGWRLRSSTDRVESEAGWNRRNVFDVHSGSEGQALDGSFYKTW